MPRCGIPFRYAVFMKLKIWISAVVAGAIAQAALSCDLCAIYAANEAQSGAGQGIFGGVAEQYTKFGTLQEDGHKIASEGQYIDSSLSQVFAGYNFNNWFGVQLSLPVIYRAYGSDVQHGKVSGIGDLSLIGNLKLYEKV